ncbi:ATPase, P-type (transporting), HAD superfamily, subfamily IC [Thiothrix caldifontis]|uniref:ATPase, P-type (Transporting), HAD superfamily, subfamily IC n=1 Tax=Thiothrix caldifontis TaxID=525918 RepID=A0A1H4GZ79_9GAMM|nr:hypothetical protein [Thiothrix caldifontis]SEB14188.1 ATPase, P-type (transporting), HAD superfamily, subfamily IC [Thiothrix caldifontis]
MLIEFTLASSGVALWHKLNNKQSKTLIATLQPRTISNTDNKVRQAKRLLHDVRSAIWGDERQQLQQSLDPQLQADVEQRRQAEKRRQVLSLGATGLAILGTSYPAFYLLGSAAVLYLGVPLAQMVLQDFRRKHFISVPLVSTILVIGMVATGQLVLAALAGLMGGFLAKLIRKAEENSQKQLINVFAGHPSHIWIEKDGVELEVPFDNVQKNDVVIVHAGETIPVDGTIQAGSASIDQHILTGESQPVHRSVGEQVFAATLILAGRISILVETAGW